ncbi:hypothetical protein BD309DRAFT_1009562 [Dichomitus squalens]|nr:hypothetical protein BD309DRAFT_1009562 [Dichomitus squalens]
MFKRVERRILKKEKEEELGLDEETKEMLGLNAADTDSDESESSSDEGSEEEDFIGAGDGEDASDTEADVMDQDEEPSDLGEDEEDEDEDDGVSMTVSESLQNPLWHVSLEPEVKACAVCPGKILKNPVMVDVHINSGAHKRRFAKLREAAIDVDPDTDIRDLVRIQRLSSQPQKQAAQGKLSKRAEKKKAKLAAIKAKRANQKLMKAKHRAKKEVKEKTAAENARQTQVQRSLLL